MQVCEVKKPAQNLPDTPERGHLYRNLENKSIYMAVEVEGEIWLVNVQWGHPWSDHPNWGEFTSKHKFEDVTSQYCLSPVER